MRYFYDTEFLEDGRTIELISIGIVAEDGREYYAVNRQAPWARINGHPWLVQNVLPTLPGRTSADGTWWLDNDRGEVKDHATIANEVRDFLLADDEPDRELWAYYSAYDHVALCQLFGTMMDLPDGVPKWTHDLMQRWELAGRPEKPAQKGKHNALEDARWNRALYLATEQPAEVSQPQPRGLHPEADDWCEAHGDVLSRCTYCATDPENRGEIDESAAASLDAIRRHYRVPAEHGGRIVFDGQPGVITGADPESMRLLIRLDGTTDPAPVHPTWRMQYAASDPTAVQA